MTAGEVSENLYHVVLLYKVMSVFNQLNCAEIVGVIYQ